MVPAPVDMRGCVDFYHQRWVVLLCCSWPGSFFPWSHPHCPYERTIKVAETQRYLIFLHFTNQDTIAFLKNSNFLWRCEKTSTIYILFYFFTIVFFYVIHSDIVKVLIWPVSASVVIVDVPFFCLLIVHTTFTAVFWCPCLGPLGSKATISNLPDTLMKRINSIDENGRFYCLFYVLNFY